MSLKIVLFFLFFIYKNNLTSYLGHSFLIIIFKGSLPKEGKKICDEDRMKMIRWAKGSQGGQLIYFSSFFLLHCVAKYENKNNLTECRVQKCWRWGFLSKPGFLCSPLCVYSYIDKIQRYHNKNILLTLETKLCISLKNLGFNRQQINYDY